MVGVAHHDYDCTMYMNKIRTVIEGSLILSLNFDYFLKFCILTGFNKSRRLLHSGLLASVDVASRIALKFVVPDWTVRVNDDCL